MKKLLFVFTLLIVCQFSYGQSFYEELAFNATFWSKKSYPADELKDQKAHTEYVYAIPFNHQYRDGSKPFFMLRIYENGDLIVIENPRSAMGNWTDMAIPVKIGFIDNNGNLIEKQIRKFEIRTTGGGGLAFCTGYCYDKAFNKKFLNYLLNTGSIRLVIEMQTSKEPLDIIVQKLNKKDALDMNNYSFEDLGKMMQKYANEQNKKKKK